MMKPGVRERCNCVPGEGAEEDQGDDCVGEVIILFELGLDVSRCPCPGTALECTHVW